MRFILSLMLGISLMPSLAYGETEYLDVNLKPTKVEINRRYHYESDVKPDENGVYTIPVYDKEGVLIVTFQSTEPVIARGTFTGKQVAEERKLGLLNRVIYALGEGFDGRVEMRDKSGYLQEEVTYVNGKRDGIKKQYYDNGAINAITHFKQNKEVGTTKRWNRNGVLVRETKRTEEGTFISEHEWNSEGILRQETVPTKIEGYGAGLKETTWELGEIKTFIAAGVSDPSRGFVRGANHAYKLIKRERATDGELIALEEVHDYGRNGEQRLYHEGFSIIENTTDGKRDGLYSQGDFGDEATKGMYKNGIKVGKWRDTNKSGDIIYETYSNAGELNGDRTVQDSETEAYIVKEHYSNGKKHGKYQHFDYDGNLDTYGVYQEGVKTGDWVEAESDTTWKGTYNHGKKVGRWLKYNAQKYVVYDLQYKDGDLNGPQYLFADNGAITLFEMRKNGIRHGKRITYENGIETSRGNFVNGQKE
ncbi:hypothetical protein Q4561_19070 [Alteromonas sp. 1_MG-2023]|uniref:toxin-antitoxin system YwqK family antitoxin n=1 Tax=Alteromonas sp. 1_MG-2023 TaxID=3062669 RepID=UPI0026E47A84|nr:hypothetical protein [Alteromonas sp. 1_MG-2023]MDO6569180.1 hypothetical protein [Alteromonas sp. 1_MG-2023]